jgi:hypothetical protein
MRILSDGAACFGTTSSRPAEFLHPDGFAIRYDTRGQFQSTVTSAPCGVINRDGTDGDILLFRKEGTPVGSIGTSTGYTKITSGDGTNGSGLQFGDSKIYPVEANSVVTDNSVDFGDPSYRFKDLYLSGGVYLGGTGAANKLDDYEEGTWTPAVSGMSYTVQTGKYTKVGDLVFIKFRIAWNALSGTTNVVTGLPFSADSDNESMAFSVYVNAGFGSIPSGKGYLNAYVSSSGTNLLFTWQPTTQTANFTTSGNIYVAGTYLT